MKITKQVSPAFEDFLFDWSRPLYLLVGGYGSGKSYHVALKLILKLFEEKRKALVVREVYDTLELSCYDLLKEILQDMGLLVDDGAEWRKDKNKVLVLKSPMRFKWHNGSEIVFKGMDKVEKVKSINGVSIVWMEECSEIKYEAFKELQGRIRTPDQSMHFILSTNPIGRENWVYKHFFQNVDDKGEVHVIMPEDKFYDLKCIVKNGVYYHHSTPDDNPWLPREYIKRLDELKFYDMPLYMVARLGQFGASGIRVLPQLQVRYDLARFDKAVQELGPENQYFGFDFGFEESYNAVLSMSVDTANGYLYIWDELYKNHMTDPEFAELPKMQALREYTEELWTMGYNKPLVADNEDPKAIAYYRQNGFRIRPCKNKFAGSRLSNTRKVKRFRKIYVRSTCTNTIRELKDLTYAKKPNGDTVYDQFNIDPHTFSAIWYALDLVSVADVKEKHFNTLKG